MEGSLFRVLVFGFRVGASAADAAVSTDLGLMLDTVAMTVCA